MRFIFAILILFIFIPASWADVAACATATATPTDSSNPGNGGTCNLSGCKYTNDPDDCGSTTPCCEPCDVGEYGENCKSCDTTITAFTENPAYTGWASHQYHGQITINGQTFTGVIRGARTVYECYKNIQNGCYTIPVTPESYNTSAAHGSHGTQQNCRKYYRDGGDSNFFVNCSETGNNDSDHNPDTDETSGQPLNTEQDLTNEQLTTHYHMDSDGKCRQNQYSCKQMGFNSHNPDYEWCITENFAYWTDGGWNVAGCGYRTTYNYSSPSYPYSAENQNVVSTFRSESVHAPYLETVNGTEVNCYATVEIGLTTLSEDTQVVNGQTILTNLRLNNLEYTGTNDNDNLNLFKFASNTFGHIYLDKAGRRPGYIKRYYCIGCKPGYVPADYPSGFDDYKSNPSETFGSCKKADNGYYSTGCSRANLSGILAGGMHNDEHNPHCRWWCGSFFDNGTNCETGVNDTYYHGIPCFAGMTTDGGATSKEQCKYTEVTLFCDAHGCFNFAQLQQQTGNNSDNRKYQSGDLIWTFPYSYRNRVGNVTDLTSD